MEIKFRAWDKNNKEMIYISDFYWFEEEGVHDSDGNGHYTNYELMLFSGVHDKNKKEIYKGDIVIVDDKIYEVKYLFAQFFIGLNMPIAYKRFKCEVIGNIYENPELLETI